MINHNITYGLTQAEILGLDFPSGLAAARTNLERVRAATKVDPDVNEFLAVAADPSTTDKALAKAVLDFKLAEASTHVNTDRLVHAAEQTVEREYRASQIDLTNQAIGQARDALSELNEILPGLGLAAIRGDDTAPRSERAARLRAEDALDVVDRVWTAVLALGACPRMVDTNAYAHEPTTGDAGFAIFSSVGSGYDDYRNSPEFDLTIAALAGIVQGGISLEAHTIEEATSTVRAWNTDMPNWIVRVHGAQAQRKTPLELAQANKTQDAPEARDDSWTALGSA